MQSVLNEISKLRSGVPIMIDYHNSNRYRIVAQEKNGTKTAYCFSTPIYNLSTRKLIDMKFHADADTIYATGSNANITLSNHLMMENAEGGISITLPQKPTLLSSQQVRCGSCMLCPTTNGIAAICDTEISITLEVSQPYYNIKVNDRCFAIMQQELKPLAVISCIGSLDISGSVVAPAKLEYQKLSDKKYRISISAASTMASRIFFEVNLYENKLFQDTTVESMNPSVNNAFGGIGFIGNSAAYGEQWLYSRTDCSRIPELLDKRVFKAVLHMPKLNRNNVEISAFRVTARFCSFGSNWDNKIPDGAPVSDSLTLGGYQSLDITSLLVDTRTKTIISTEGLILKSQIKGSGFSVIATGDSYFAPQVLQINYR